LVLKESLRTRTRINITACRQNARALCTLFSLQATTFLPAQCYALARSLLSSRICLSDTCQQLTQTLLVPLTRTAAGQHSFAVNGPRTRNSLPAELRTPDTTLCSFKRHLKAHLFQQ